MVQSHAELQKGEGLPELEVNSNVMAVRPEFILIVRKDGANHSDDMYGFYDTSIPPHPILHNFLQYLL